MEIINIYTLEFLLNKELIQNKFSYKLPNETLLYIQELNKQIQTGFISYSVSQQYHQRNVVEENRGGYLNKSAVSHKISNVREIGQEPLNMTNKYIYSNTNQIPDKQLYSNKSFIKNNCHNVLSQQNNKYNKYNTNHTNTNHTNMNHTNTNKNIYQSKVKGFASAMPEGSVSVAGEEPLKQIKLLLNQLTCENYKEHSHLIIELIIKNPEKINILSEAIFEIISVNKFYSNIYADIFLLVAEQNLATDISLFLENKINEYIISFDNLYTNTIINPNTNYAEFCSLNEENERRKAYSLFFIHLTSSRRQQSIVENGKGIISATKIIQIILILCEKLNMLFMMENKKNIVDEITENLFILFNKQFVFMNKSELLSLSLSTKIISDKDKNKDKDKDTTTLFDFILKISKSKPKEYKSLTNKTIFQFMDIYEIIKT